MAMVLLVIASAGGERALSRNVTLRLASVLALLALSFGLAACGGFDSGQPRDSGGGAEQFIVPGADNTIQEFGSEATGSESEEIATALHNFLDARARGNWHAACAYLAPSTVRSYEKLLAKSSKIKDKNCAGVLEAITSPATVGKLREEAAAVDVGSVRVKGRQAFAIYTGPGGAVVAVSVLNENGVWRVGSITALL